MRKLVGISKSVKEISLYNVHFALEKLNAENLRVATTV